jgi:putative transposase
VTLLRSAPKDLRDYFRSSVRRKVDKDRTVTLSGKLYEAPVGLIGRTVTLLYHEQDPGRIEVFHEEASAGFLVPLAAHLNSRVRRSSGRQPELIPPAAQDKPRPGSLFTREVKS